MNDPTYIPMDSNKMVSVETSFKIKKQGLRLFWLIWKLIFWINLDKNEEGVDDEKVEKDLRAKVISSITLWFCESDNFFRLIKLGA
jgi:hypothetical protein